MGIQIRNVVGANSGVVSVSLNASVSTSPAKLTVTSFNGSNQKSGTLSFGGIRFVGELIAKNTHYEQGKMGLITEEYIDSSVRLDRKNIVLFRRGLPSRSVIKYKTVTIPTLSIVSSGSSSRLQLTDRQYEIAVERKVSTSRDVLGEEEWSSNPCEAGAVSYSVSEALSLIGINGSYKNRELRVAYEGSYRSVLGSICGDLGMSYWCDWSTGAIKLIDSTHNWSVPSMTEGCGILSADIGFTKNGTSSSASWVCSKPEPYDFRSDSITLTTPSILDISPVRHRDYPTDDEILYSICPAYKKYKMGAKGFGLQEVQRLDLSSINFSLPTTLNSDLDVMIADIWDKYQFNPSMNLLWNIKQKLGLVVDKSKVATTCDELNRVKDYTNDDVDSPDVFDELSGYFSIVRDLSSDELDTISPKRKMELFYPYQKRAISVNSTDAEMQTVRHEFDPQPSQRLAFDAENKNTNDVLDADGSDWGLWRSVSPWIDQNSDIQAPDFDNAVNDMYRRVDHNLICEIIEYFAAGGYWSGEGSDVPISSLRCRIEVEGASLAFVQPPKYRFSIDISESSDSVIHPDDQKETISYIQERASAAAYDDVDKYNAMVSANQSGETSDKFAYLCGDKVQQKQNALQNDLQNIAQNGNNDLTPGLLSAGGRGVQISCNGKTIRGVIPGDNAFRIIARTNIDLVLKSRKGQPDQQPVWDKMGDTTSNNNVLSHSVNITEVESDSQLETLVPIAHTTKATLSTFSAVCDGFYFPPSPSLTSLSANLEMGQLVVSYNFQEIPASPLPRPYLKHSHARNTL